MTLCVVTTAFMTALSSIATWRYTQLTEKIYEASQTPSLAVEVQAVPNPSKRTMYVVAHIKNVGASPALDFRGTWTATVGSTETKLDREEKPQEGVLLAPGQTVSKIAWVRDVSYDAAINGTAALSFHLCCTYSTPTGKRESFNGRYDYDVEGHFFGTTESR